MPRAPDLQRHGATRSLLDPEPVSELRRVDDAGDAGPARHKQPRNLRVAPARLGRGGGILLLQAGRLQPPLAEERAAPQELVRQVPGQQLVASGLGPWLRERRLGAKPHRRAVRLDATRVGPSERRRWLPLEQHRLLRRRRHRGVRVVVVALLALPEEATATWRLHRRVDRQLDGPDAPARQARDGIARRRLVVVVVGHENSRRDKRKRLSRRKRGRKAWGRGSRQCTGALP